MPCSATMTGFAAIVTTPLSWGASRSSTARALARSACCAVLSRSSDSLRRAGPGLAPIALIRAASAGASGAISPVIWPSDAALEFSVSFPDVLTRSKLPAPSSITPVAWPIFNCSSANDFGAVADLRHQRAQFLTGRCGAADIEREPRLVRPFDLRARQRTRQGGRGIEIETFRLQLGVEPRGRPPSRPPPAPRRRRRRSRPSWLRSPRDPAATVRSPRSRSGFWLR